jgi:hypothetical protein
VPPPTALGRRATIPRRPRLYLDGPGGDVRHAEAIYHEDAVLEFPQSGERFDGRACFTEWRSHYPAEVSYRLRRVAAADDLVVLELSASYDGGPEMLGVTLLEFRGDRVVRERVYVTEPWEAPAGASRGARRPRRTPRADPRAAGTRPTGRRHHRQTQPSPPAWPAHRHTGPAGTGPAGTGPTGIPARRCPPIGRPGRPPRDRR